MSAWKLQCKAMPTFIKQHNKTYQGHEEACRKRRKGAAKAVAAAQHSCGLGLVAELIHDKPNVTLGARAVCHARKLPHEACTQMPKVVDR